MQRWLRRMEDRVNKTCQSKREFYEAYREVIDNTSLCSLAKAAVMLLANAGVKPERRRKQPRRDPTYYYHLLIEAAKRIEEKREKKAWGDKR